MTDTKPKEEATVLVDLTENIFLALLVFTFEFAIIYFVTTLLIFTGLYATVWSIQTVGLLAIFVSNSKFAINSFKYRHYFT